MIHIRRPYSGEEPLCGNWKFEDCLVDDCPKGTLPDCQICIELEPRLEELRQELVKTHRQRKFR